MEEKNKLNQTNIDESFAGETTDLTLSEATDNSDANNSTKMSVGNPNQKKENQKENKGPVHYNRKQRRPIQLMIQKSQHGNSGSFNFETWAKRVRDNQAQGKQLSERFEQIVMKSLEYQLTTKEASIRTRLISEGKSKKKVNAHIEEWYDKMKIWKEEAQ